MPEAVTLAFDYSSLDDSTSQFVQQQTLEIKGLFVQTAQGIKEIGQRLIDVKERLGHGNFLSWLEAEFAMSESTAQRFMRVGKRFKSVKLTDFQIAVSALYLLSAPSMPNEVVDEALARAQAGESITPSKVEQLKQEFKVAQGHSSSSRANLGPKQESSLSKNSVSIPSLQRSVSPKKDSSGTTVSESSWTATPTSTSSKASVIQPQPLPQTKFRIKPGSTWRVGKHLLYCGIPDSHDFEKHLPAEIGLLMRFTSSDADWFQPVIPGTKAGFAMFSPYMDDQNWQIFRDMVGCVLKNHTESGSTVALSYLPDPSLLVLLDDMDCVAYCAEPDIAKCEDALVFWTASGREDVVNLNP